MDNMLDSESVAWLWVIEAAANCKGVSPSFLYDLIKIAPKLPSDLEKNTRERVALRCLEDLCVPYNENVSDIPPAQGSKVRFDLSESCEDVLQRIMKESTASDLQMAKPLLSRWDIYPFVMHKSACMQKYALGQLKDAILDGTHSYADFLGKKSGLALKKGADRTKLKDNHFISLSFKPNQSFSDVQTTRQEGNCDSLRNKNKELEENPHDVNRNRELEINLHDSNIFVSKRDRVNFGNGDMASCEVHRNIDDSDDQHIKLKKMKLHASSSFQLTTKNPVPLRETELPEDLSASEVLVTEREGCDLAANQVAAVEEGMVIDDGRNEYILSKRGGQGDGSDALNKCQSEIHCNDAVMPQVTCDDKTQHRLSVNEAIFDGVHCTKPRNGPPTDGSINKISFKISKFNSEHNSQSQAVALHPAYKNGSQQNVIAGDAEENMNRCQEAERSSDSDGYRSDGIDVTMKKHEFLSSQCTNRQNSSAVDEWTELNLCVKCNEGGQLLVCKSSSCPLFVHEHCLGFSTRFDDKGDFYCPFCAYSRAIKQYLESKRKASLAKNELDVFICAGSKQKTTEFIGKLHEENKCTKGKGAADFLNKTRENGHSGQMEEGEGNQNELHMSKVYDQDEENHDAQFQKFVVDKQPADPVALCRNVNPECEETGEEEVSEEKGEEEAVQKTTEFIGKLHEEENKCTKGNGEVDFPIITHENGHSRQMEVGEGNQDELHMSKVHDQDEENHDVQFQKLLVNKQKADPAVICYNVNPECEENGEDEVVEEKGEEEAVQECTTARSCEEQPNQVVENSGNLLCRNSGMVVENQRLANVGIQQEILKEHTTDIPEKPVPVSEIDDEQEEISEDENSMISNYRTRVLRTGKQYTYPITQSRRKKKPRTTAEEELLMYQTLVVDKQQADPAALWYNVNPECEEKGEDEVGEEKEEEDAVQECTTTRSCEEQPNQVVENSGNLLCGNSGMVVENQQLANVGIQQEILKERTTDIPEKPVPVFEIDDEEEEISENDNSMISNYRTRVLRTGKQYTYPLTPQSRRKKKPWTTAEEELLMEGVKRFSGSDKRKIPWTEILEFGRSVFLKGRTAMDLKDKWRNMCKGLPWSG